MVNIKELKARLSAYLREVDRGEEFLVTDRSRVVARLVPPRSEAGGQRGDSDVLARLAALGARLPLRERRPTDYRRSGKGPSLRAAEIDALMAWVREEPR